MIKPLGYTNCTLCDLEHARNLNFSGAIVLVDGRRVSSYDELVRLVSQNVYRNRETIEVVILPLVTGG
jgi:hypothetical protein